MNLSVKSSEYILPLADPGATLETVGGKGASLARLTAAGLHVPDGFHVTTAAYRRFVAENDLQPGILAALESVDIAQPATLEAASTAIRNLFAGAQTPPEVASAIALAYAELAGRNPVVAVRSSATAEDLPEASFAGQQDTFLNVQGSAEVLEAIKRCWASLWTARAIGYRARQGIQPDQVALAVVVQVLVPAEAAGILFTANPINNRRDQAVINASWGLGESIVGGEVTPDTIVVEKGTGQVIERQTSDKQVMTARVNAGTQEQPVPEELRLAPVLDDRSAVELVRLGITIEQLYGTPMDIEWALADGAFAIVQARPVTGLPEDGSAIPPTDGWDLPDPKGRYMRTSVIDLMPDPLSPLFATLGVSTYNQRILQMLAEFADIRKAGMLEDLIVTIRDYAYMKANFSASELWTLLVKLGWRIPRLIRQGPDHFREVALPAYQEKVKRLSEKPVAQMTAAQIWSDAHEAVAAAMYHLSILQVDTLGAAAGSEGLFTAIYNKFFRKEGDPEAPVFLMGYDTTPIRSEKSLYDLANWALEQPALSNYVMRTDAAKIVDAFASTEAPAGIEQAVWTEWQQRFDIHLKSYGYMLYDLDFAKPLLGEDPAPQVETVKMFIRGLGTNPYERQGRLERLREQATEQLLQRARGLRGWALRKAIGWAQALGKVREDSYASIGLAYPRFRELLLDLGRRMADAGAFKEPEDIFWLEETEIEDRLDALERGAQLESMQAVVENRKKIRQAEVKLVPPTQLPYSKTYMGLPLDVFVPTGESEQEGNRLKGVGASGGEVSGVARVLQGPEDFDQMRQGDILVAKLTTPAWTPLFAMASGIVTDIGGPLSHGSIVAREYGIPAVLGTGVATRRIRDGQTITVNGNEGIVTLNNRSEYGAGL